MFKINNKLNSTYNFPAISVIIPMYNVERYVGQCLGSLLGQTFQNFEVIVVDDCSTDNSVAIVESIVPKFNGRLQLIKRKQNAGAAAIPRNTGIGLSRGKYIFFLDSDDIIVNDAFDILYNAAEQTKADVVHVEKYYVPVGTGDIINENTKFRLDTHQSAPFVDKITLENEDIGNRIEKFCQKKFLWWACSKLFRRDFIMENHISFVDMISVEDMIFTFSCVCLAKVYVRIPGAIYVYRTNPISITKQNLTVKKQLHRYITVLLQGVNAFIELANRIKIFSDHPEYKGMIINFFIQLNMEWEAGIYFKAPLYEIDLITNEELSYEPYKNVSLHSYIFNIANLYRLKFIQSEKQILALQKQIQNLQNKVNYF